MNNVTLMGRLTKDPDVRTIGDDNSVCNFTIAVDREFSKNKEVDFLSVVVWGKTADFVGKYFAKGRKIALTGRIQTRNYEKDGNKVYITEVVANTVYFADSKPVENNEDPCFD